MKKWIKILIVVLITSLVTIVLYFANEYQNKSVLQNPEINIIVKGENAFLTKKELYQRLYRKGLIYQGQRVENLQINRIERFIKNMTEVLDARVYRGLGTAWNVDVEIRRPIARIFNKYGQSFYLDELGHTIAPSYLYTARVVVVTGDIRDKKSGMTVDKLNASPNYISNYALDDIYRLTHYIVNNKFFNYQIGQIHMEKSGKYILIPRVGGQKIIFGSAYSNEEVKVKFRKLADFYKEGLPYEGWNAYDCIDLSFENQVVCSKTEAE
jgi:cell division protein FtsQ